MNTMMQLQLLLGTGSAAEAGKPRPTADAAAASFRDVLVQQKGAQQAPLPGMQALARTLETTDREALDELFVQFNANPENGTGNIMARLATAATEDSGNEALSGELSLLSLLQNQMAWQEGVGQQQPGEKAPVGQGEQAILTAAADDMPPGNTESATIQAAELAGLQLPPESQHAADPARVSASAENVRPTIRTAETMPGNQRSSASTLGGDFPDIPVDKLPSDNRAAPELRFQPIPAQHPAPEPVTGRTALPGGAGLLEEGVTGVNGAGFQSPSTGEPATLSATRQDPAQAALQARLGTPQWGADFGRQMATMVRRGDQQVSLHLNPRELGPLSVDIRVHEQQAQLQLVSAHAQVRSAVEQALPQLREALAEQGINLGETSVSDQRSQSREGDSDERQTFTDADEGIQPGAAGADTDTVAPVTEGVSGINLYV